VGTEWLLDGRAWRVVRQLAPDRFVAQDAKFLVEQEFAQDELLGHYAAGRLQFAGNGQQAEDREASSKKPATVKAVTTQQKRILQRRWKAIEPLAQSDLAPQESDYAARAAELQRDGKQISARTLRRYYQAWLQAGKDRMALVPRGDRTRRGGTRKTALLEKYAQIRKLVDEAIQSVYLTKARRPMSAVTRRVLEDLQRLNARLPAAQAIPVPRQSALGRAIARRIGQLDPWEVDRQRWGRKIADRRHKPTSPQQMATRVLQRVEIDHSPLKVVVGTDAGPIGQPWLSLLIDYYSRMVVGFCLGFEPPSYAVIMEALRHAILPKSYLKDRYSRVQGSWPCFGLPEKLVCDRGSDLTSKDLEDAAFQLGIELDFNPPRTPHFKGTVESFFDGLNDTLASTLPGRTFRSWVDRADYRPDIGPLITYEALLEIVHIHLVDVYAASKHPTATVTRLEMWQDSAAVYPPCIPATPDELLVLLSKRAERTLSPRGIELGGMFYTSDDLMALRSELAGHNVDSNRVTVRYNPWDLGDVWVLSPIDGAYLKASAIDSAMRGMTEYQWRVLKRAIRERFDQPDHLLNLAAGRNAIRDVVEAAMQKPSGKRRVRVARFLQSAPSLTDEPEETGSAFPDDALPADTNLPSTAPSISESSEDSSSEASDPSDVDVDDWEIASPDL
jgi:putative transposase